MHIEKTKIFSALSNEVRLRCVYLLARHGEACVCELVDALAIAQPTASKALANLKAVGLLADRRDANWIYYRVNPSLSIWHQAIISATVEELSNCATCKADEKRFIRLTEKPRETTCI